MWNRRHFLEASVAGSLATGSLAMGSLLAPAARGANTVIGTPDSAGDPQPAAVLGTIIDQRFAPAALLAGALEHAAARIWTIRQDVTQLWYSCLAREWRERGSPVAGLTCYAVLFCLEHLARGEGMRVVFRGEHRAAGGNWVAHSVLDPGGAAMAPPDVAARSWTTRLADRILLRDAGAPWSGRPPAMRARPREYFSRATRAAELPEQVLYSWVIARPVRA
jgi:hypothetical protein